MPTPDLTPERRAELRRLREAATQGEWFAYRSQKGPTIQIAPGWLFVGSDKGTQEDAVCAAAAVNALVTLLDALDAAEHILRAIGHAISPDLDKMPEDEFFAAAGLLPGLVRKAIDAAEARAGEVENALSELRGQREIDRARRFAIDRQKQEDREADAARLRSLEAAVAGCVAEMTEMAKGSVPEPFYHALVAGRAAIGEGVKT